MSKLLNMTWANQAGVSLYVFEEENEQRRIEIHGLNAGGYEYVIATATIEKHNRDGFAKAVWNPTNVEEMIGAMIGTDKLFPLCPVHDHLFQLKPEPFDNCVVCIRNERNELRDLIPLPEDAQNVDSVTAMHELVSEYPGKGDSWADFLHHRKRVIKDLRESGRTSDRIAHELSMDEGQVVLISQS